jgi:hypothetical protein
VSNSSAGRPPALFTAALRCCSSFPGHVRELFQGRTELHDVVGNHATTGPSAVSCSGTYCWKPRCSARRPADLWGFKTRSTVLARTGQPPARGSPLAAPRHSEDQGVAGRSRSGAPHRPNLRLPGQDRRAGLAAQDGHTGDAMTEVARARSDERCSFDRRSFATTARSIIAPDRTPPRMMIRTQGRIG